MVQALMAGRKTETRRMRGLDEINLDPENWNFLTYRRTEKNLYAVLEHCIKGDEISIKCPFKLGPTWIRETWVKCGVWDGEGPDPSFARNFIYKDEIRLERLQDITEEGAIAEGIDFYEDQILGGRRFRDYVADASGYGDPKVDYPTVSTARESFSTLITSINGPECWEKNYWTWVLKFHKIEKPN